MANLDNTIQEHSLFDTMIQLEDKLYLNVLLSKNHSRDVAAEATVLLAKIYQASGQLAMVDSVMGNRNQSRNFEITSYGYTIFAEDIVAVTARVSLL